MKTNYYILFILLLSFSVANAQSTETVTKEDTAVSVSVEDNNNVVVVDTLSTEVVENNDLILDAAKLKETIARSSSDIRVYLNRVRNVDNIKIVFPKMNKDKKA